MSDLYWIVPLIVVSGYLLLKRREEDIRNKDKISLP